MRCNDCNKFVAQEMRDPEVDGLEVTELDPDEKGAQTVEVTGSVMLAVECAECGSDLKTAELEVSAEVEIPEGHTGDGHELAVEESGIEGTEDFIPPGRPARYQKHMYGASLSFQVTCSCGNLTVDGEWGDAIPAGSMDEC